VRGPEEVINDPQLRPNEIVVPIEGAGSKVTSTISSPIQVQGVAKVPANGVQISESTTTRSSAARVRREADRGLPHDRHHPASVAPAKAAAGGKR